MFLLVRKLRESSAARAAGLGLVSLALAAVTFILVYKPAPGTQRHWTGHVAPTTAPVSDEEAPEAAVLPASDRPQAVVSPVLTQQSPEPTPTVSPRSSYRLKVQDAGGGADRVAAVLAQAKSLGYEAAEADVTGKARDTSVVRYKPGYQDAARRAAEDLWPEATTEEHDDISVELVLALGKT